MYPLSFQHLGFISKGVSVSVYRYAAFVQKFLLVFAYSRHIPNVPFPHLGSISIVSYTRNSFYLWLGYRYVVIMLPKFSVMLFSSATKITYLNNANYSQKLNYATNFSHYFFL